MGASGGTGEEREIGESDSSDDDDVIGPPLPPGYSTKQPSDKGVEKDGEGDESEEDGEEDDSVCTHTNIYPC